MMGCAQPCVVSYASVHDAVWYIMGLAGEGGALMAKFDIASAYQIIPVHTEDRLLLGMTCRGDLLVDGTLRSG